MITDNGKSLYHCEFAPDGKTWIRQKTTILEKAWDFLNGEEAQTMKSVNKQAKIRIVNARTGIVVGNNH